MQPYLGIIRFAAMLALMAIGGTSMTLMMGGFWHHAEKPPSPSTTAVDQTSTLQAEPATHEPKLRLDATTPPEAEPTSIAPTAIGPAETQSKPLMAIESTEAATETSPTEASPRRESLSDATAHVPAYPTTPYPAPTLPHFASESLPRVQTAEPAIATLKGVVEETQSR